MPLEKFVRIRDKRGNISLISDTMITPKGEAPINAVERALKFGGTRVDDIDVKPTSLDIGSGQVRVTTPAIKSGGYTPLTQAAYQDKYMKDNKTIANVNAVSEEVSKAPKPTLPTLAKKETITPAKSELSIKDQIAEKQAQSTVDRFKAAFEQTKGRLEQEEQAIDPRFRKQESLIGVQDTMQRTADQKALAQQGLSASGAVGQGNIAQNVITQGALGASREQEQTIRADIERRLSEAQSLRDQGIATAQSEADLMMLQNKLYELDALTAKQEASELTAKAEAEARDAQIKADYLSTIGRFYGNYQAEINKVKNDGDPTNDWQIPYLEEARQQKIVGQGLDQSGQPIMVDNTAEIQEQLYNRAYQKWKAEIPLTQEEMGALGVTTSTKPKAVKTPTAYKPSTAETEFKTRSLAQKIESMGLNENTAIQYLATNRAPLESEYGKEAVEAITALILNPPQEVTNYIPKENFINQFNNTFVIPDTPGRTDANSGLYIEGKKGSVDKTGMLQAIEQYVIDGTMSEQTANELAIYYGL